MNNLTNLENIASLGLNLQTACVRAKANQGELLPTSSVSVFHREVDKVRKELFAQLYRVVAKEEAFKEWRTGKKIGLTNESYNLLTVYWRKLTNQELSEQFVKIMNENCEIYYSGEELGKLEGVILDYGKRLLRKESLWFNSEEFGNLKNIGHDGDKGYDRETVKKLRASIDSEWILDCWREALLTKQILFIWEGRNIEDIVNGIEESNKKFKNDLSNISGTTNLDIIKHLTKTSEWGPNNYIRERSVIAKAKQSVEHHPVVIFSGIGGLGKTALAKKLVLDYVQKDYQENSDFKPDQFLFYSTKDDLQGEMDETEPGKRKPVDRDSIWKSFNHFGDKTSFAHFRQLCNSIIYQKGNVDGDWTDSELEEKCIEILKKESWLIVLDNFEDILSPNKEVKFIDKINEQKKLIEGFLKKIHGVGIKRSLSRVIVTTRAAEDYSWGIQHPVPYMAPEKGWELLRKRVEFNRDMDSDDKKKLLWDEKIYSLDDTTKDEKAKMNDILALVDTGTNRLHPLIIIHAASPAYIEHKFEEMVKHWSGEEGKTTSSKILEYICSKMATALEKDQKKFLEFLLNAPECDSEFTYQHIRKWYSTEDEKTFAFNDLEFLDLFVQNGWLSKPSTEYDGGISSYFWKKEIRVGLIENLGLNDYSPNDLEEEEYLYENIDDIEDNNRVEEIKKMLQDWYNWYSKGMSPTLKNDYSIRMMPDTVPILNKILTLPSKKITEYDYHLLTITDISQIYEGSQKTLSLMLDKRKELPPKQRWMDLYFDGLLDMGFISANFLVNKSKEKSKIKTIEFLYQNPILTTNFPDDSKKIKVEKAERMRDLFHYYNNLISEYLSVVEYMAETDKRVLARILINMGDLIDIMPKDIITKEQLKLDEVEFDLYIIWANTYGRCEERRAFITDLAMIHDLRSYMYWASLKISTSIIKNKKRERRKYLQWRKDKFSQYGKKSVNEFMNYEWIRSLENNAFNLPSKNGQYEGEWILKGTKKVIEYYKKRPRGIVGQLVYVQLNDTGEWMETNEVDGIKIRIGYGDEDRAPKKYICRLNRIHGKIIQGEILDNRSVEPIHKIIMEVNKSLLEIKKKWSSGLVYQVHKKFDPLINKKFEGRLEEIRFITGEYIDDYRESICRHAQGMNINLEIRGPHCGIDVKKWPEEVLDFMKDHPRKNYILWRGQGNRFDEKGPLGFPIYPSIFAKLFWDVFMQYKEYQYDVTLTTLTKKMYGKIVSEEKDITILPEIERRWNKDTGYCENTKIRRAQELADIMTNIPGMRNNRFVNWHLFANDPEDIIQQISDATVKYIEWRNYNHFNMANISPEWESIVLTYFKDVKKHISEFKKS